MITIVFNKPIAIGFILSAIILSLATYLFFEWWVPNQRMRDIDWWSSASQEEIRSTSHQVLRFPFGNLHDALLSLETTGNADSVPLIIQYLKWHAPANPDDFGLCTHGHAVDALRSLTGQNFGLYPAKWETWWKEAGSKQPPSDFYPRVRQSSSSD